MINTFVLVVFFWVTRSIITVTAIPPFQKSTSLQDGSSTWSTRTFHTTNTHVHRRTIVGGTVADPTRYPYYVRLDIDGEFACGASLIQNDFVLTAAHCTSSLASTNRLTVAIGGYNETVGLVRSVTNVYNHFAYDENLVHNDIALLKIDPIPAGTNNIPLLQWQSDRSLLQIGDSVTAIGLGATSTDGPDAENLKEVELKTLDEKECDGMYQGDIHRKSMLCASDIGEDSCQGDSGGPLILLGEDGPESDIQVGIVSWGEGCADPNKPGVYTDLAFMNPWIETIICSYSESPPEDCEIRFDFDTKHTVVNLETDICRDFAGAFYVSWWHQFQRCDWLRDNSHAASFCMESNEAWVSCPLTCHGCTYETDDDSIYMDDWTNYDQTSNQAAMISVFLLSFLLFCLLSVWLGICRRCRNCLCRCCDRRQQQQQRQQQQKDQDEREIGDKVKAFNEDCEDNFPLEVVLEQPSQKVVME